MTTAPSTAALGDAPASLLATMPWGVLDLAPDGTVALLNPVAAALWGLPAAAVQGRRPAQVHPAVLPPALVQALTHPAAEPADYWLPHTQQWVCQRTAPAPDGHHWVFWENATARYQTESTRQYSAQLLRATIDSSPDLVQVFEAVRDEHGAVVDFAWVLNNAAAEQVYGDVIGQRLCQLNPGVVVEGIFDTFRQVVETGVPDQHERHYVHEQFNDWFVQFTVKLGDGVATTTRNITARKRSEQEILQLKDELMQRATDKYHALLSATTQGFCLLQLLFDETGQHAVDFRYLELNAAFAQHAGLPADAQGKAVSELVTDLEPLWLETYGRVALTGQAERLEYHVAQLGRWYDAHAFRMGAPEARQVGVLFSDATARKQQEQRQAFLLKLSDALQPLTNAVAIQGEAARVLGEHLGAGRTYYVAIDDAQESFVVEQDYIRDDAPSVVGVHPFATFGPVIGAMRARQAIVIEDTQTDPRVDAADRPAYAALALRSFVVVPLVKDGVAVSAMAAVDVVPRRWTPDEAALVQEVAERTWDAVERARAEEALRKSEQRLQTLIASLPGAAAFVVGPDLRYQLAGGEALDAAGLVPADLLGRTVAEAMPPELAPQIEANYRRALAGQDFSVEHTAYGHTYFSRGVPLPSLAGSPEAVLVVSYDISERKQAEEALAASEEQFRAVANLVPDLLWRSTPDSDTTWYNQRWYEYTGQTPAAAAGYGWTDAIHPDDRAESSRRYRTAVADGQPLRQEHRIRSAGGEYRWFQVQAWPLRNEHGEVTAWYGAATDIHARRQAEEVLRASEVQLAAFNIQLEQRVDLRTRELQASRDLLQSVFDTSLISMSVMEAVRGDDGTVQDFRLRLVSRELARETGRTDLVGTLYAQEYPGIREVGLFELAVRTIETGEPQGVEYYYPHEGFNKWFACQFVKLEDGVVATNLDITERKTAEQERTRSLHLLTQAEAVAGMGSWDYNLLTQEFSWSDGMYQLFGLPVGRPVGPDVYLRFVVDEDRPRAEQVVAHIAAGTDPFEETLRLRINEQVKTVRIKAVVLRDEQSRPVRVLGVDLDISELRRLEADNLRLRLTQQQALFEAVQGAQEAERKRMAEALHNGLGQMLFAIKLHLDQLHAPLLDTAPALVAARRQADQLLGEAIRQTRALSHELVPMVLEEFGFARAFHDLCRKLSSRQLRIHCQAELEEELPAALQLALFRIGQELVQNVVKHARGATEASLELETVPGFVLLRVEDNGPGFAAGAPSPSGLGLRSIRDRVALLSGTLDMGNVRPTGAYIRIRIPLPDATPAP